MKRVHRVLSLTLWGVVAITFGCISAYSSWLVDFGPTELREFHLGSVALNGEWIEVSGTSPRRLDVRRSFLISTLDSRWLRLPRGWGADISEDGRRALLLAAGSRDQPSTVNYVDLDEANLAPVATSILVSSDAHEYLSPSGDRLAIKDGGVLSVYELDDQRILTAARLPENLQDAWPYFVDDSTIRLYHRSRERGDWTTFITELDVGTGVMRQTGSFTVGFYPYSTAFDAGRRYVAITDYRYGDPNRDGSIFDARTGEFIRPVSDFAAFLQDGRVLRVLREGYEARSVVAEDIMGRNSVQLDLPVFPDLSIIGEWQPGQLLLAHSSDFSTGSRSDQVDTFDLETGATEHIGDGLSLVGSYGWADGQWDPAGQRLFWKGERTLVRWDPDSGELVPVVVGAKGG